MKQKPFDLITDSLILELVERTGLDPVEVRSRLEWRIEARKQLRQIRANAIRAGTWPGPKNQPIPEPIIFPELDFPKADSLTDDRQINPQLKQTSNKEE